MFGCETERNADLKRIKKKRIFLKQHLGYVIRNLKVTERVIFQKTSLLPKVELKRDVKKNLN